MLYKWNRGTVKNAILSVPLAKIIAVSAPEDYVTEQYTVHVGESKYQIFVRGFRTDQESPEDTGEIEMVEVTTGYSDGDMPQDDPLYIVYHAQIKAALVQAGYTCTVNSLDPYF